MKYDNIKWKIGPCFVENCWCAAILTIDDKEILGEGSIGKELAEYIVSLHNSHLTTVAPDKVVKPLCYACLSRHFPGQNSCCVW